MIASLRDSKLKCQKPEEIYQQQETKKNGRRRGRFDVAIKYSDIHAPDHGWVWMLIEHEWPDFENRQSALQFVLGSSRSVGEIFRVDRESASLPEVEFSLPHLLMTLPYMLVLVYNTITRLMLHTELNDKL